MGVELTTVGMFFVSWLLCGWATCLKKHSMSLEICQKKGRRHCQPGNIIPSFPSGKLIYLWKITIFNGYLGKSTISMSICNRYVYVDRRIPSTENVQDISSDQIGLKVISMVFSALLSTIFLDLQGRKHMTW